MPFLSEVLKYAIFFTGICLIYCLAYSININKNYSLSLKYFISTLGLIVLLIYPALFFFSDRTFGAIPLSPNDFRGFLPYTLIYLIVVVFKYISLQAETIKNPPKTTNYKAVLLFSFFIPHCVWDPDKFVLKTNNSDKQYHFKRAGLSLLQYSLFWIVFVACINFVPRLLFNSPLPDDVFTASLEIKWLLPLVMGSGVTTIAIFIMIANILSLQTAFYNIFGNYNFKYFQDKPFLATSVGEYWRKWNLWAGDWFNKYLYKPLRRKYKLGHTASVSIVFIFSAFIHAWSIALINIKIAWVTFLVFIANGIAVILEKPILKVFPFISKLPSFIKFIFTLLFLMFTLGYFGLCFG